MRILIFCFLLIGSTHIKAQGIAININNMMADTSAILDISSSNKGLLIPRLTASERNNISLPAEFLMIFNTGSNCLETYIYEAWHKVFCPPSCGTAYDADNNAYNTVVIGGRCWLKENLGTTKYSDGSPIHKSDNNIAWESAGIAGTGTYAWYNYDSITHAADYGAIYNWYAVDTASNGGKNICPVGWRVPSQAEWLQLTLSIKGGTTTGGNQLKSCRQVQHPLGDTCSTAQHPRWDAHGVHFGIDSYGFSALPGGFNSSNGTVFYNLGSNGNWWTSTELNATRARTRNINTDLATITDFNFLKTEGISIRCIKE